MMKNYKKNACLASRFSGVFKLFGLIALLGTSGSVSAQLNGTSYTINSGAATSCIGASSTGTNFTNWSDFVTYFNTYGITSTSKVTVVTDQVTTVTTSLTLTQYASAPTSSTRRLIIEGNSKKLSSSATYEVLGLNGIDYLTIKDLIVENSNTGSYQSCIRIYGGADYCSVKGCTLQISALTSGTTAGGAFLAWASTASSLTSTSTTHNGSFDTIDNCLMRTTNSNSPGPTYAIVDQQGSSYYSSASYPSNNTVSNCTIQNFYYMGIRNYYTNGEQFKNNDISRANATSNNCYSSIYMVYNTYTYSTGRPTMVDGNKIHDLPYSGASSASYFTSTVYGIMGQYCYGNSANYFTVTNNSLYNIHCGSTNYIGYFYGNYYTNCSGNKVSKWNSYSTGAYFYGYYSYYMYYDFKFNNNVVRDCFTKYYTYMLYDYYGDKKQINGNKFINNITADGSTGYTYVFYNYYPSASYINECNNNVIDSNTFGSYAYGFFQYYWNGTFNRNIITNNKLYNANYSSYYGYIYSTALQYFYNFQANNNLIANNYGYYGMFGFYAYSYNSGAYTFECRQNTIQADGSKAAYTYQYIYALYTYPYYHTTIDVAGNIVDVQNSYGAYPAYTYNTSLSSYKRWDYNTYYLKNVTYPNFYCPSGSATDVTSWLALGFCGTNDNGVNPKFKSLSTNQYQSNAFLCHNNVPQTNGYFPVTTPNTVDVYGKLRNPFKSDRGAVESPMNIQALKTDFSVPANVCAGYQTASNIYVKNKFVDTVYNFNVAYSINGGPKTLQLISTKIAPGATQKVDFKVPIGLNISGATKIRIFVDAFDDTLSDDTFTFNTYVTPAPGGGSFIASTKATTAIYQYGKQNDVTVVNAPVYYDIPKPRKYTNAGYGTDWEAFVQAYTIGGRSISGATITSPSGSSDLEVKFVTADATLEDTMVTMVLRILDKNNNCDTFIKRKVLIYPSINVDFGFPTKICDGDAVLFSNKCKVLSGSMEFKWNFGTTSAADTSSAPEPVFQFTGKGTYNVTLTAKTMPYGFSFSKTYAVTVNAIPTVGFTKANACQGKALTFNNTTTPTTGTVMNWNFGDNTTSTLTNPTKKYAAAGTYNVTLKADLNGCVATMTQKVYQFDKPTANFVLASGKCDNETFNFTNKTAITSGLVGSFWDFNDNGAVSTDESPSYKFETSGTKSITLVATSEFGCADTVKKSISVKESPKTSFINTPLCSVKPTDFTNTTKAVAGTNAVYAWDFGDGTTSGVESPTHDWNAKLGPKKVTYTITLDNGCTQTVSKDLVVLTQPKPNFVANDVCSGDDVVFVNNTTWPQGDISYKWDFGDGTTSTNSDPSKKYITSVTLTPKVTLYAYIAGGCADSITQEITINEAPRTCDFVATPDYANGFYAIKVEPMNANGVVGGQALVNYVWVFEGGGTKNVSGVNAAVSNDFPADGTYKVTMRAKMQQTTCECSITKNVVMNRASAKELMNTGVSVYPNPANNQFNVALTENFGKTINIQLLSMSGQVVKNMTTENTGIITVDASALSSGVYMVQISNGSEVVTRKMNIQK